MSSSVWLRKQRAHESLSRVRAREYPLNENRDVKLGVEERGGRAALRRALKKRPPAVYYAPGEGVCVKCLSVAKHVDAVCARDCGRVSERRAVEAEAREDVGERPAAPQVDTVQVRGVLRGEVREQGAADRRL